MINPVLLCSGCVVIMINPVLLGSGCVVIMINLVSLGSGCVIIIIIPICYIPAGSVVNHPDNSCLLCSRVCALHDNSCLLGSGCVVIIIIPICYIPAGSVVILIIPVCYVLGCVLFMINPIFILAFLYVILDFLCEIPQYSRSVLLEAFVHLHKKLY